LTAESHAASLTAKSLLAASLLEQTLRVVGDTACDAVVEQARHNSDSW
jgi:hypothetical protein